MNNPSLEVLVRDNCLPLPSDLLKGSPFEGDLPDFSEGDLERFLTKAFAKRPGYTLAELFKAALPDTAGVPFALLQFAKRLFSGQGKSTTSGVEVHLGDLELKGDHRETALLVVTGRLKVEGVLTDCGPESMILVGGDLKAKALNTDGEIVVGGNLSVEQVIYGHYNDNCLWVGANLTARVLIEDDHAVICEDSLNVENHVQQVTPEASALFVDAALSLADGEKRVDRSKLFELIKANKPYFRGEPNHEERK